MQPIDQGEIEALVRAYLGRLARRYTPLALGLVALILVAVLVPTRSPSSPAAAGSFSAGSGSPAAAGGAAAAGPGGSAGGSPQSASGGGAPGTAPGPGGSGSSGGGGPAAGGVGSGAPSGAGVARSGVRCGPGVRQVPWSPYAPPCVPAFTGANGGATTHGVTASTITLSYRVGNSTQDTAVYAAAGGAAPAPDSYYIADLNTYIGLFNRTFELYGRHVVLKAFTGQGDYILEDQGQDQAAAQADAVTAHDLGAFADVSFQVKGSNPYWTGLAQEGVVAMGPLGFPDSYYQRHAPYWWSWNADGSQGADYLGNAVCERAAGLPASFAGEADLAARTRTFGLVTPDNPEYLEVADQIQGALAGCGVKVTKRISYAINVTTYESEATSIAAQLKTAGVTSVICYCDPIVPIFLSDSAHAQSYFPEWFEPYYLDAQGRLEDQTEWSHAISDGGQYAPRSANEAYKAFVLAQPGGTPREQYYDQAYFTLLQLFIGLQAAGPDLTPASFARGMASLPESGLGMEGHWQFGPGRYSPPADLQVGWWDPGAVSNKDGGKGAWLSCDGGKWFPIAPSRRNEWGPAHTQLHCFNH